MLAWTTATTAASFRRLGDLPPANWGSDGGGSRGAQINSKGKAPMAATYITCSAPCIRMLELGMQRFGGSVGHVLMLI
jgi:hypothetical protein